MTLTIDRRISFGHWLQVHQATTSSNSRKHKPADGFYYPLIHRRGEPGSGESFARRFPLSSALEMIPPGVAATSCGRPRRKSDRTKPRMTSHTPVRKTRKARRDELTEAGPAPALGPCLIGSKTTAVTAHMMRQNPCPSIGLLRSMTDAPPPSLTSPQSLRQM